MTSGKKFKSRELYSSEAGKMRDHTEQEASQQVASEPGEEANLDYSIVSIFLLTKHILFKESFSFTNLK